MSICSVCEDTFGDYNRYGGNTCSKECARAAYLVGALKYTPYVNPHPFVPPEEV